MGRSVVHRQIHSVQVLEELGGVDGRVVVVVMIVVVVVEVVHMGHVRLVGHVGSWAQPLWDVKPGYLVGRWRVVGVWRDEEGSLYRLRVRLRVWRRGRKRSRKRSRRRYKSRLVVGVGLVFGWRTYTRTLCCDDRRRTHSLLCII